LGFLVKVHTTASKVFISASQNKTVSLSRV
jgi:hypothetical protein